MAGDLFFRVETYPRAKRLLAAARRRLNASRARDPFYTTALWMSGVLQVAVGWLLYGIATARGPWILQLPGMYFHIVLTGLAFLPALAALRRGDLIQRLWAVPLTFLPIGTTLYYAHGR